MRLHGYCETCHKVKMVLVTRPVPGALQTGICVQCEKDARPVWYVRCSRLTDDEGGQEVKLSQPMTKRAADAEARRWRRVVPVTGHEWAVEVTDRQGLRRYGVTA